MRVLTTAILAFLCFVFFVLFAAVIFQVGLTVAGTAAATAAAAAYPANWHPGSFLFPFAFLFPFLFVFLIFGLASAAFGRRAGGGYGRHWGGPRMWEEWHRELHERDKAGAEKAER